MAGLEDERLWAGWWEWFLIAAALVFVLTAAWLYHRTDADVRWQAWYEDRRLPAGVSGYGVIGIGLLTLGGLSIFDLAWHIIWPLLTILLGLFIALRRFLEHECAEFLLEASTKLEARKQLEEYAFLRTSSARYQGQLTVGAIAVGALTALYVANRVFEGTAGPMQVAVTGWVGLGALMLGVQQWRAARNETSLDKFYDRLEVTNRQLDDCPAVRSFAGPWLDEEGRTSEDPDSYYRTMYVYRELDNLEYAIAKYRIGFMSSESAGRSLRTFLARCEASEDFCRLAEALSRGNLGYKSEGYNPRETQRCVDKAVSEAKKRRDDRDRESRTQRRSDGNLLDGVRVGMEVRTSDHQELGSVVCIFRGHEPRDGLDRCDDETCIEVDLGVLCNRAHTMYVPYRAIDRALDGRLILNVDRETACSKGWARKPSWLGPPQTAV